MTTQEKIEVLERAIPLIDTGIYRGHGVCLSIHDCLPEALQNDKGVDDFFEDCGIKLPKPISIGYCWKFGPEGDEQRRDFLRTHIERLRKTLTTPYVNGD